MTKQNMNCNLMSKSKKPKLPDIPFDVEFLELAKKIVEGNKHE